MTVKCNVAHVIIRVSKKGPLNPARSCMFAVLSLRRSFFNVPQTQTLSSSLRRLSMLSSKPQPEQNSRVLVFGAGNFGSCLASHLGDSQHEVYMWAREENIVNHFNLHHRNPMYLPDHTFPSSITAIGPKIPEKDFINGVDVLLFAIPTQFLRLVPIVVSEKPKCLTSLHEQEQHSRSCGLPSISIIFPFLSS